MREELFEDVLRESKQATWSYHCRHCVDQRRGLPTSQVGIAARTGHEVLHRMENS